MGDEQDKLLSEDEDFEVTNILDPDLQDGEMNLNGKDLDSELNGLLDGDEVESEDDILDIDELLLDEDLDSVEITASGPSGDLPASKDTEKTEDDFDFELTDLVEAGQVVEEKVDFDFEEEALPAEEEIEEDIDFELEEEVVEPPTGEFRAGEPEGLEEEIETGLEDLLGPPPLDYEVGPREFIQADEAVGFESVQREIVAESREGPAGVAPGPFPAEREQPPPAAPFTIDQEKIERMIETAVRETVSRVIERLLPGLVEEVLGRELEKLRAELEED